VQVGLLFQDLIIDETLPVVDHARHLPAASRRHRRSKVCTANLLGREPTLIAAEDYALHGRAIDAVSSEGERGKEQKGE
jgi:hypothetical protein